MKRTSHRRQTRSCRTVGAEICTPVLHESGVDRPLRFLGSAVLFRHVDTPAPSSDTSWPDGHGALTIDTHVPPSTTTQAHYSSRLVDPFQRFQGTLVSLKYASNSEPTRNAGGPAAVAEREWP
ncbi:hypothetical protein GGTG_09018 [Gaeumannomyces tritici R3-111a-1]|uniref:Uncharacterized protein n=1 Tax=Gaeumannomyces tritici (strain R3-111a-1) TaxID=644352 RepID=J3P677_GAET3|nr:hypothetical protein GGTG_09018 [Gaeumannomyces tritici R3-111a-1]EJT72151.1 hypothetical protein GGTG_09018 [Gaeumannomyces tritici R3-111a-1]